MTVDRELLARYLRQRQEMGAGDAVLDTLDVPEALRLLARRPPAAPGQSAAPPKNGPAAAAAPGGGPAASPGTPAGPARELGVLAEQAAGCTRCGLAEGRTHVVFGEGAADADVVVIGEAPGGEEDRTGRPFVGPAGKLLDMLLLSAGLPRERVYICNVLKCRPPNNRNPLPGEVESCSPYLRRQIDLISPRVLLAVGKFAAQTLLESEESIGRLRGRLHECGGRPLIVTYHPAYLLRSPQAVRGVWQDFQRMRQVLDD